MPAQGLTPLLFPKVVILIPELLLVADVAQQLTSEDMMQK
jgi:hypothetical protein